MVILKRTMRPHVPIKTIEISAILLIKADPSMIGKSMKIEITKQIISIIRNDNGLNLFGKIVYIKRMNIGIVKIGIILSILI